MTPTPEQLAAIDYAIADEEANVDWTIASRAQAAWDIIATIVRAEALEEAAKACEDHSAVVAKIAKDADFHELSIGAASANGVMAGSAECAAAIRALKVGE